MGLRKISRHFLADADSRLSSVMQDQQMKYKLIAAEKAHISVRAACRFLHVSESGFYAPCCERLPAVPVSASDRIGFCWPQAGCPADAAVQKHDQKQS